MEVADRAKNTVSENRRITVPEAAWLNRNTSTARVGQTKNQRKPSIAGHSPRQGMVCENGVCHIPEPGNSPLAKSNIQTASRTIPAKPVIGSPGEYADPPLPDGYKEQANFSLPVHSPNNVRNNFVQNGRHAGGQQPTYPKTGFDQLSPPEANRSKSIDWGAEPEDAVEERAMVQGSTIGRNLANSLTDTKTRPPSQPDIQSLPIRDLPDPVAQSEPGKTSIKYVGDQFISESTTGRWNPNAAKRLSPTGEAPQMTLGPQPQGRGGGFESADHNRQLVDATQRNPQPTAQSDRLQPVNVGDSRFQNSAFGKTAIRNGDPGSFPKPPSSLASTGRTRASYMPAKEGEALNVNSRQFNLNYGIDAVDPSGVENVVLWMTRDGGRSWKSWATDRDNVSPMSVSVKQPGLYGFRIVVHSRDGLTGIAPRPNDSPDVLVNVDLSAPRVQITSVPYGRGPEAGRLIINWKSDDNQLMLRPITLAYADSPAGPWTLIEHGIRNTGRYVWKVGTEVPERLFLKIESRDVAGNVGVFELQNPIDVSGLVPRGRIHGIEPVFESK